MSPFFEVLFLRSRGGNGRWESYEGHSFIIRAVGELVVVVVVHSMLRQPAIHTKTRTGLTSRSMLELQSLQFQVSWVLGPIAQQRRDHSVGGNPVVTQHGHNRER